MCAVTIVAELIIEHSACDTITTVKGEAPMRLYLEPHKIGDDTVWGCLGGGSWFCG